MPREARPLMLKNVCLEPLESFIAAIEELSEGRRDAAAQELARAFGIDMQTAFDLLPDIMTRYRNLALEAIMFRTLLCVPFRR